MADITPAIADCGYREPLLPRLAWKIYNMVAVAYIVYLAFAEKSNAY